MGSLKLWSLFHVVKFEAERFLFMARFLEACAQRSQNIFSDELTLKQHIDSLQRLAVTCAELELLVSAKQIIRFVQDVGHDVAPIRGRDYEVRLRAVQDVIEDELRGRVLLQIPANRLKYYKPSEPFFDKTVIDNFPSAIIDIEEAGNCFACERGTAAVFHLMRVVEVALKVIAKPLGIPYAPSWESYLKQITKQINQEYKDKTPEWKTEEPFFRDISAYLHAVRVAWRNPTMHVVQHYNMEQAEEVLNAVKGFMRHVATKLREEQCGAANT